MDRIRQDNNRPMRSARPTQSTTSNSVRIMLRGDPQQQIHLMYDMLYYNEPLLTEVSRALRRHVFANRGEAAMASRLAARMWMADS